MFRKSVKYLSIGSAIGLSMFITLKKERIFADSRNIIDIEFQERYGGGGGIKGDFSKYGFPQRSANVNHYTNHALCYNYEKRIPHWVLELLINRNTDGDRADRGRSGGFKVDPSQHPMFASHNEDYKRSGWSRGHMAAAGNHKFHQRAMDDTFFLSNIVPQDIENNSGFWNRLEIYTRDLLQKYDKVWVLSGPLFLPVQEAGKMVVKYEVIGNSQVAVPTHLFKVLLAERGQRSLLGAFVVPNRPVAKEKTLIEHQVSLEFVENKSGLVLFPNLDRSRIGDLCKEEGCGLKSWQEFEIFFITKKVKSATSLQRLEKAFGEVASKGLKPDKELLDAYRLKKAQLLEKGSDHAGSVSSKSNSS